MPSDTGHRFRVVSIWAGAAFVVVLLAVALVFANAFGAARVAANARGLHETNSALGSAALARVAYAQAVVFGADADLGVVSRESADLALAEAVAADDAAVGALALVDVDSGAFTLAGDDVLRALADGDTAGSRLPAVEEAYGVLRSRLGAVQEDFAGRIEATESTAGLAGTITRWLVTLLIPGAALVVYRNLVRRQAQRREFRLNAKLDAERELRRARDEFIAGFSHELRTPLTSIYGFSEVLLELGLIDPEESLELIGLINQESSDLSRMVEDLLITARLDAGSLRLSMERVAVSDEIDVVLGPFRRTGRAFDVGALGHAVRGDRERIRHVLRNLLDNACRHGGERVSVRASARDGSVMIAVADDGDGVPDDVAARMFEPFVHDGDGPVVAGSVGMGLSTARRVARAMGGDVRYWRGQGVTVFTFVIHADAPVGGVATESSTGYEIAAAEST